MKACIYTFSGTGAALLIADQVRDVLGETTIAFIPQMIRKSNES